MNADERCCTFHRWMMLATTKTFCFLVHDHVVLQDDRQRSCIWRILDTIFPTSLLADADGVPHPLPIIDRVSRYEIRKLSSLIESRWLLSKDLYAANFHSDFTISGDVNVPTCNA